MDPQFEPSSRFREDLEANLRLAEALAPTYCAGCSGYHLARVRRRLKSPAPDALDRSEMVQVLRDWLAAHRASPAEPVDILIAGSADTNLLATCAEAASDAEGVRYTVVDRCRTPLALCEAFARQHRLEVQTRQFDMGAPDEAFAADVIVVHSLLRFLPGSAHLAAMVALRRWLKPGGAIVFSHRLMPDAKDGEPYYQAEYQSVEPIKSLFAQAGLRIVSLREAVEQGGPRHRILALLQAG
jgi:hypothetical protein